VDKEADTESAEDGRTDAGLTISELAKRAGVLRDTISNVKRGQHSLQAPTLNKLARAPGTDNVPAWSS
jgi:transcriptional regulator with XRE-family HTH domain